LILNIYILLSRLDKLKLFLKGLIFKNVYFGINLSFRNTKFIYINILMCNFIWILF